MRKYLDRALEKIGVIGPDGRTLRYTFHDFRRMFITDAILHGMPPHIAQLVAGHRDINTTMGYKAVYPEEVIAGHRAFIARRRALRPSEEYRMPTDEEWEEFLGHFARRKVALGECGRSYATPCIHEHSCLRRPLLRPDPAERPRLVEIRDITVEAHVRSVGPKERGGDETWPWISDPSIQTYPAHPVIDGDSAWILAKAVMELASIRCPVHGMADALADLHASVSLLRQGRAFLPQVVADARAQDRSWQEIAAQLQVSPATARRRYPS